MTQSTRINQLLWAICILLGLAWLMVYIMHPIQMNPDSYGYQKDALELFNPAYVSQRPLLYPAFLRLMHTLGIKISITAYLINLGGLCCLLKLSRRGPFFTGRNAIVMLLFLSLFGIWGYVGTCLTESILPSVMLWIFIPYVYIVMNGKMIWWKILLNAVLMSSMGILLKPWIMMTVIMASAFLVIAAFIQPALKSRRWPIILMLAVNLLSLGISLSYSRDKSPEVANIVLLMISSGNEPVLQKRLETDKGLTPDSARFIQSLLTDIHTVNEQFKGNIWQASWSGKLTVLNIFDKRQQDSIRKGFHLMYFKRPSDFAGLVYLAFYRYISEMQFGLKCLDIAYGPHLSFLDGIVNPFWLILGLIYVLWMYVRTRPHGPPVSRFLHWWRKDKRLWMFTSCLMLSGILSCLLLCIAGGDELRRTVLPPVLFQLFALVYYEGKNGENLT
jgi:hypothetical protein